MSLRLDASSLNEGSCQSRVTRNLYVHTKGRRGEGRGRKSDLSEVTLACIVSLLLTCFHQARVEHYPILEVCVALGRYVCYSHRLRF